MLSSCYQWLQLTMQYKHCLNNKNEFQGFITRSSLFSSRMSLVGRNTTFMFQQCLHRVWASMCCFIVSSTGNATDRRTISQRWRCVAAERVLDLQGWMASWVTVCMPIGILSCQRDHCSRWSHHRTLRKSKGKQCKHANRANTQASKERSTEAIKQMSKQQLLIAKQSMQPVKTTGRADIDR